MKKTVLMNAAKKARIALSVMALCGMSFVGAQDAFAADPLPTTDLPVKTDANKNIICGDGAKAEKNPESVFDVNNAIILGNNAEVGGGAGVAIGKNAKTGKKYIVGAQEGPVAIGSYAQALADATTAVGGSSSALGEHSTAIGYLASAEGTESIAIGRSQALEKGSMAIGHDSKAKYKNSIAIGYKSVTDAENTVSVGSVYEELVSLSPDGTAVFKKIDNRRRITYVADGVDDHDAATVGQVKSMIAAGGSASFDGTKLNTDIQNVDVAGGYKETTANANAETKGTIAGAINSAYQAGKDYTDTQLTDKVGTLTNLNTTEKGNLVGAVNEVKGAADSAFTQANTNKANIGTLTNLTTTEKGNLVGAVNEVKGAADAAQTKANDAFTQANTNKASIGTLTNLTTTEKTNLVGAVNEVKGTADTALGLANTNKDNIGTLTNLTTTEKGNLVGAINEVKGSVDAANTAIAGKADLDLGNISTAGETKIKDLASIKAGEVVADKLGAITSTNYVSASGKVNANISVLDKQVKANADDIIEANTKITNVDNKIGSLSTDGTYIKKANNVSANLVELDKQLNTNATAITNKANQDLSNINAAGENIIKNLAGNKAGEIVDTKLGDITSENYVKKTDTVNANISALDKQVKANADGIIAANTKITAVDNKIGSLSADGKYIKKANNVSENLVELDKQVNTNATAITTKANLDPSNINAAGENVIKNLAGNKAGEIVDVKLGAITSTHYVNAGNTVNANISALDTQLNKVENKIGTMTDGNYISAGNTVAGNLSALDNQLKVNADAINTKADKDLSNITDAGKNVIKDLAGNKAGEIVDTKLGDITSENYVKKADTVNANISALDKQVKANADAINTKADKDLSNITDAGKNVIKDLAGNKAGEVVDAKLGDITSENYVKKADTVNANISALDKQMKANADDIITANTKITNVDNKIGDLAKLDTAEKGNLVGAVNEVNKKADKNADDIKTVNGRVDDLGGRVDTLGGAVSKLDTKVNKVGAGAAALAALHPMDFDPDNKLTFAAGVGNYCGANAAAIGAFYRPNEQVMFSIAGNMGNGENMVNAGVSFALDRPSQTPTTKAALVKTVAAQNEQIAALNETVAEQNEKIARLEAMVEKLVAKQNA